MTIFSVSRLVVVSAVCSALMATSLATARAEDAGTTATPSDTAATPWADTSPDELTKGLIPGALELGPVTVEGSPGEEHTSLTLALPRSETRIDLGDSLVEVVPADGAILWVKKDTDSAWRFAADTAAAGPQTSELAECLVVPPAASQGTATEITVQCDGLEPNTTYWLAQQPYFPAPDSAPDDASMWPEAVQVGDTPNRVYAPVSNPTTVATAESASLAPARSTRVAAGLPGPVIVDGTRGPDGTSVFLGWFPTYSKALFTGADIPKECFDLDEVTFGVAVEDRDFTFSDMWCNPAAYNVWVSSRDDATWRPLTSCSVPTDLAHLGGTFRHCAGLDPSQMYRFTVQAVFQNADGGFFASEASTPFVMQGSVDHPLFDGLDDTTAAALSNASPDSVIAAPDRASNDQLAEFLTDDSNNASGLYVFTTVDTNLNLSIPHGSKLETGAQWDQRIFADHSYEPGTDTPIAGRVHMFRNLDELYELGTSYVASDDTTNPLQFAVTMDGDIGPKGEEGNHVNSLGLTWDSGTGNRKMSLEYAMVDDSRSLTSGWKPVLPTTKLPDGWQTKSDPLGTPTCLLNETVTRWLPAKTSKTVVGIGVAMAVVGMYAWTDGTGKSVIGSLLSSWFSREPAVGDAAGIVAAAGDVGADAIDATQNAIQAKQSNNPQGKMAAEQSPTTAMIMDMVKGAARGVEAAKRASNDFDSIPSGPHILHSVPITEHGVPNSWGEGPREIKIPDTISRKAVPASMGVLGTLGLFTRKTKKAVLVTDPALMTETEMTQVNQDTNSRFTDAASVGQFINSSAGLALDRGLGLAKRPGGGKIEEDRYGRPYDLEQGLRFGGHVRNYDFFGTDAPASTTIVPRETLDPRDATRFTTTGGRPHDALDQFAQAAVRENRATNIIWGNPGISPTTAVNIASNPISSYIPFSDANPMTLNVGYASMRQSVTPPYDAVRLEVTGLTPTQARYHSSNIYFEWQMVDQGATPSPTEWNGIEDIELRNVVPHPRSGIVTATLPMTYIANTMGLPAMDLAALRGQLFFRAVSTRIIPAAQFSQPATFPLAAVNNLADVVPAAVRGLEVGVLDDQRLGISWTRRTQPAAVNGVPGVWTVVEMRPEHSRNWYTLENPRNGSPYFGEDENEMVFSLAALSEWGALPGEALHVRAFNVVGAGSRVSPPSVTLQGWTQIPNTAYTIKGGPRLLMSNDNGAAAPVESGLSCAMCTGISRAFSIVLMGAGVATAAYNGQVSVWLGLQDSAGKTTPVIDASAGGTRCFGLKPDTGYAFRLTARNDASVILGSAQLALVTAAEPGLRATWPVASVAAPVIADKGVVARANMPDFTSLEVKVKTDTTPATSQGTYVVHVKSPNTDWALCPNYGPRYGGPQPLSSKDTLHCLGPKGVPAQDLKVRVQRLVDGTFTRVSATATPETSPGTDGGNSSQPITNFRIDPTWTAPETSGNRVFPLMWDGGTEHFSIQYRLTVGVHPVSDDSTAAEVGWKTWTNCRKEANVSERSCLLHSGGEDRVTEFRLIDWGNEELGRHWSPMSTATTRWAPAWMTQPGRGLSATPPSNDAPQPPVDVLTTRKASGLQVVVAPTSGGIPVAEHLMSCWSTELGSTDRYSYRTHEVTWLLPGLKKGTTYQCSAQSVGITGQVSQATVSDSVTIATPPTAPRSLRGTGTDRGIALEWEASTDLGGAGTVTYVVEYRKPGSTNYQRQQFDGFTQGDTETIKRTVAGLDINATYQLRVLARNASGESEPTEAVTVTTLPGAPSAPLVTRVALPRTGNPAVTWNAPVNDGGSAVTRYDVTCFVGQTNRYSGLFYSNRQSAPGHTIGFQVDVTEPSTGTYTRTIPGAQDSIPAYDCNVTATNKYGTSQKPVPVTGHREGSKQSPGAPTLSAALGALKSIRWDQPQSYLANGYNVYLSNDQGKTWEQVKAEYLLPFGFVFAPEGTWVRVSAYQNQFYWRNMWDWGWNKTESPWSPIITAP